ncbi:MAG: iron-sulfur cluster assembly protein [Candidatus Methylacidiphilales bacterium]|nr:iron-sulfur cluster assembly protein [Candidatus Methylacidiphilales bacterium]
MSENGSQIQIVRDVDAVQIPAGTSVTLHAGSVVVLTQSLGGSFTVHSQNPPGLFRIASKDAPALGLQSEDAGTSPATGSLEERIWERLKTCYDPEIPVNIVDLGLVYSMVLSDAAGGKRVDVKMTLTAPGCGMGPSIAADAKQKILSLKEISEAEVEVVWEPQWNPSMISPEGKQRLGIE